jgi:hypothetical protein
VAQLPVVRQPAPAPKPRPAPQVALRPVEVPPPDALGIQLEPEAVTVPDPHDLGIKLD